MRGSEREREGEREREREGEGGSEREREGGRERERERERGRERFEELSGFWHEGEERDETSKRTGGKDDLLRRCQICFSTNKVTVV